MAFFFGPHAAQIGYPAYLCIVLVQRIESAGIGNELSLKARHDASSVLI